MKTDSKPVKTEFSIECASFDIALEIKDFICKNIKNENLHINKATYFEETGEKIDEEDVIMLKFISTHDPDDLIDLVIEEFGDSVGFMFNNPIRN